MLLRWKGGAEQGDGGRVAEQASRTARVTLFAPHRAWLAGDVENRDSVGDCRGCREKVGKVCGANVVWFALLASALHSQLTLRCKRAGDG